MKHKVSSQHVKRKLFPTTQRISISSEKNTQKCQIHQKKKHPKQFKQFQIHQKKHPKQLKQFQIHQKKHSGKIPINKQKLSEMHFQAGISST